MGILFTGYIEIPAAGNYTFHLRSDSGANLFIHDGHVIDDDFAHDGTEQSGSIVLTAGLQPIRLYYRHGKAASHRLSLAWEGPGISKQKIPAPALFCPPQM